MSSDQKLERFGLELFNLLFFKKDGLPLPLGEHHLTVRSAMSRTVFDVVVLHSKFFQYHHEGVYTVACHRPLINVMDFFHIISKNFPHRHLQNSQEEVMRKFVSSCAYFHNMIAANNAVLNATNGDKRDWVNFFQKAHIMWAMFANSELKEEFYANGGWFELQRFVWKAKTVAMVGLPYIQRDQFLWLTTLDIILRMQSFLETATTKAPLSLQWVDRIANEPRRQLTRFPEGWSIPQIEELFRFIRTLIDPKEIEERTFRRMLSIADERGVERERVLVAMLDHRLRQVADVWDRCDEGTKKLYTDLSRIYGKLFNHLLRSISQPAV